MGYGIARISYHTSVVVQRDNDPNTHGDNDAKADGRASPVVSDAAADSVARAMPASFGSSGECVADLDVQDIVKILNGKDDDQMAAMLAGLDDNMFDKVMQVTIADSRLLFHFDTFPSFSEFHHCAYFHVFSLLCIDSYQECCNFYTIPIFQ